MKMEEIAKLFKKYNTPVEFEEPEITIDEAEAIIKKAILYSPGKALILLGPVGVGKTAVTMRAIEEIAKEMQNAGLIKYIIKLDRFPEGTLKNWKELLEKNGYLPGYSIDILDELKEFIREHVEEVFLIAQVDIAATERVDYIYPKVTKDGILEHQLLGQLELLAVKKVTKEGVLEPRGVIVTDEITNADEEMLKFVLRLIRERRISDTYLSKRLNFIAMGNRTIDNALASELDAASITRANVIHITHTPWKKFRIVLEKEFEKFLDVRRKELPEPVFKELEKEARERFARALAVLSHETLRESAYTTEEPMISGDRPFPTERSLTEAVIEYSWENNYEAFIGRLGDRGRVIIEMLKINPPSVSDIARDPRKFIEASEDQKMMFAALLGVAFRDALRNKDTEALNESIIGLNLISDPKNWSREDLALEAVITMLAAVPGEEQGISPRAKLYFMLVQGDATFAIAEGWQVGQVIKKVSETAKKTIEEAVDLLSVNVTKPEDDLVDIDDLDNLEDLEAVEDLI